jgi:hypothetical protein
MPGGPFTLLAGEEQWRIISPGAVDELRFDRQAAPKEIAGAIADKLRGRGYQGEGALLALPSFWCFSAGIATADLLHNDRRAMAFRLEEKLPMPAESFTADFAAAAGKALGVCVPIDKVQPLITALESAGVVVQSVSPAVMLAVQEFTRQTPSNPGESRVLVWGEGERASVLTLHDNLPAAWALVHADPQAMQMQVDLATMELDGEIEVLAFGLPDAAITAIQHVGIAARLNTLEASITRIAGPILSGAFAPWFELRRGAMAVEDPMRAIRRSINAALSAAAILCVVLTIVFVYRSIRYDHLAAGDEKQLAEDFQSAFHGWSIPPNVRATLASEKQKLTLAGTSALPSQTQESALRVLREVLAKIPSTENLNIDTMVFNDTSIELHGKSKVHEAVDGLVAAARAAGMDVGPPQMSKDAAGLWTFTVRGVKAIRTPIAQGNN